MIALSMILYACLAPNPSPATAPRAQGEPRAARVAVDEVMARVRAKYRTNERKYETLAKKVDKSVRAALRQATWTSGPGAGQSRPMVEHPFVALIDQLTADARAQVGRKKNPDPIRELLTRFPWSPELELPLGLQFGSDRPVPRHTNGFIDLGSPQGELPGFPELLVNQYLTGLDEIVGWRYRIKAGKGPRFAGRTAGDPPVMETELPGWEHLRVLLQGSLPEVELFAIPQLTRAIHAELIELRRAPDGSLSKQDQVAALLDSKWNGFSFQPPYARKPMAVVAPVHALMTDRTGFLYRFPDSARLSNVGDLPFVSDITNQQYAKVFRGETFSVGDFIASRPGASASRAQMVADCAYLSRYRHLLDLLVRAVLSPNLRYPAYLEYVDYRGNMMPVRRETSEAFDMPRKHALVLWAYAGKDPTVVARFLHEKLLGQEDHRFPNDVALPIEFIKLTRTLQADLLNGVGERLRDELGKGNGDFEREFSPRAEFRAEAGAMDSDFLMHSFHAFHEQVTALIAQTALATVAKEIGAKDLGK